MNNQWQLNIPLCLSNYLNKQSCSKLSSKEDCSSSPSGYDANFKYSLEGCGTPLAVERFVSGDFG